jgi:general secretion pathway protein H
MATASQGQRRRRGFTVIELMVVVMIIGLIAGTVAMSMDAMLPRSRLSSEVRALAATLQGARSDAIARNAEFLIEYDLDNEAYRVISPFGLEGGLVGPEAEEEDRLAFSWHEIEAGVEIASVYIGDAQFHEGQARVRFDPLGAASGHAVVFIQPEYENYYTIEVLALTGLIHFHEGLFSRDPPDEGDFH